MTVHGFVLRFRLPLRTISRIGDGWLRAAAMTISMVTGHGTTRWMSRAGQASCVWAAEANGRQSAARAAARLSQARREGLNMAKSFAE